LSINVRTLRNNALLTLKKSSERAEMHWRHWQKIEAGQVNITLQTLVRLAEVLDIDPADLLREPPPREAAKGSDRPLVAELPPADPRCVEPRCIDPRPVEVRPMEVRSVEPRPAEPHALELEGMES